MYTCINLFMYGCVHMYLHVTYMHVCMHSYICFMPVEMYVCGQTYMNACSYVGVQPDIEHMHPYFHVDMHVYM